MEPLRAAAHWPGTPVPPTMTTVVARAPSSDPKASTDPDPQPNAHHSPSIPGCLCPAPALTVTGGCSAPHRGGRRSCHGSQLLRVPGIVRGSEQQGPALTPVSIPGPGQTTTSPISPVPNPFRDESGPTKTPRDRLGRRCLRAGHSLGLSGASWCCSIRHPDTCRRLSSASPAASLDWLRQPLPQLSCARNPVVATPRPLRRG